jgi:hypothetical protein
MNPFRKEEGMKNHKWLGVLAFLAVLAVAGCAAMAVGPGDRPDPVPPKLVITDDNIKTWDRPGAFGPVPFELKAIGDDVCGPDMKAVGYHPDARDEYGNKFEAGGYLCR